MCFLRACAGCVLGTGLRSYQYCKSDCWPLMAFFCKHFFSEGMQRVSSVTSTYSDIPQLCQIVPRWRCETCQPLKPLTANLWKHMKTVFASTFFSVTWSHAELARSLSMTLVVVLWTRPCCTWTATLRPSTNWWIQSWGSIEVKHVHEIEAESLVESFFKDFSSFKIFF